MTVPMPEEEKVRARIKRTWRRDTAVELAIRREACRRGVHYRVDRCPSKSVRSRPDMVFTSAKVGVYIDWCFGHGWPKHGTWPKNNYSWWKEISKASCIVPFTKTGVRHA